MNETPEPELREFEERLRTLKPQKTQYQTGFETRRCRTFQKRLRVPLVIGSVSLVIALCMLLLFHRRVQPLPPSQQPEIHVERTIEPPRNISPEEPVFATKIPTARQQLRTLLAETRRNEPLQLKTPDYPVVEVQLCNNNTVDTDSERNKKPPSFLRCRPLDARDFEPNFL